MHAHQSIRASSDLFPNRLTADAENRDCEDFDDTTLVSTSCKNVPNFNFRCSGNSQIALGYRALGNRQGIVATPELETSGGGSDLQGGRMFVSVTSFWDDIGYKFHITDPAQFEITSNDHTDGLIALSEARGLPGSYSKNVTTVGGSACADSDPPTDDGFFLNHHGLRSSRIWTAQFCNPDVSGGCSPITLPEFLFW